MIKKITLSTHARTEMIDITHSVTEIVREANVESGFCIVYTPHTTAAITINENADPNVTRDIVSEINSVIPFSDNYRHLEGNSAAHIKSSIFGASELLLIEKRKLFLGTWQGVYFCEFDGRRTRKIYVKIVKASV